MLWYSYYMHHTPSPSQVPDTLGAMLADLLRLLRADFYQRGRSQALAPQLHRLLLIAHRIPGCRQVELASWLDLSPVTVGRMLDRLEQQGLIRRETHPTDRRATRVHVEAKALPLVRRLTELLAQAHERALAGMSIEDREALMAGLRRVHANLSTARVRPITGRRHGS